MADDTIEKTGAIRGQEDLYRCGLQHGAKRQELYYGDKNDLGRLQGEPSLGIVVLYDLSGSNIEQGDFINCAIEIDWNGTPMELLQFLNGIEASMGRVRGKKNGPRIIDLDILLYGSKIVNEDMLTIPHKELHRRKFAILPCLEIEPDLVLTKPLASFLSEIGDDQKVTRLEHIAFSEDD